MIVLTAYSHHMGTGLGPVLGKGLAQWETRWYLRGLQILVSTYVLGQYKIFLSAKICLNLNFRGGGGQGYSGQVKTQNTLSEVKTQNTLSTKISGFPLGLENLEKWEGIFQSGKSQGILNRLEKSGKITQNTGKLMEFKINII